LGRHYCFNGCVDPSTIHNPKTHIYKWTNLRQFQRWWKIFQTNNYIDIANAEVLLIAAEASAELSNLPQEQLGSKIKSRERARNWGGRKTDFPEDCFRLV